MRLILFVLAIPVVVPLHATSQAKLINAFPNLTLSGPVDLQNAGDGLNRLFAVEQEGRIQVFKNSPSVTNSRLFLDLTDRVYYASGSELGLLGLAFHPSYASNGFFFVNYTATDPLRTVVARFQVTENPDSANRTSEYILLEIPQPYTNHNGGQLAFGPDGLLYVAVGDGGSGGDPHNNGQSLTTLLGKILRIDVNNPGTNLPYGIPSDNPFVGNGSGLREEIFAYGFRNPWRFSFDGENGTLWCADVGQSAREEIDIIEKGKNYGWRIMEGSLCYSAPSCDQTGLTLPVWDYGRDIGGSVVGGYVYRGQTVQQLMGRYIFGDFVSGIVASLAYDGTNAVVTFLDTLPPFSISSFGVDESGELYVCAFPGTILKFPSTVTSVISEMDVPASFVLNQNYPNPFNSSTHISFSLPSAGHVSLSVYTILGAHVVRLVEGPLNAGNHRVVWETAGLPTGVYFSRLTVQGNEGRVLSRPMLLLR
jgi:hypothetical protein